MRHIDGIIANQFKLKLTTHDKCIYRGVLQDQEVILLQQVGGMTATHKKSDIQNRTTSAQSLMPPGLQQLMTFDDLVDLVEYLAGLKAR